jgi:hypothetical protein
MGVTIRQKNRKQGDNNWWIFVSHLNRRTSLKVGSKTAAMDVQRELQVMLAVDRIMHDLTPRERRRVKLDPELERQADNLRSRLWRLWNELEVLLGRNH